MNRDMEIDSHGRGSAIFRERVARGTDQEVPRLDARNTLAGRRGLYRDEPEEDLIPDERAELRPAQWVERKLVALLSDALLPISHIRLVSVVRGRRSEN
jgi:hypothetical protein